MYSYGDTLFMIWCQGHPTVKGWGYGSHMFWSYSYDVYRVLVCCWDDVTSFIIPGCTVIVILY